MIFYATKKTLERYKLKTPDQMPESLRPFVKSMVEQEQGNALYEWGCKLFHFDRRKCLQIIHFKTRLVIFLIDIKMADIEKAPNLMAQYLFALYESDKDMQKALERYFDSSPIVCFDKITNRSIIAKMNFMQSDWAWDGYRFYDYIRDGILHTKEINRDVNEYPFSTKENGKEEWHIPYTYFADVIKAQSANNQTSHAKNI